MSGDVVRPHFSSFRRRFSARQAVVGTFIKTPTTHATEIFGALGYDFVVIDEEHAPIDRAMTDVMLLAARASNLAGIVRVSSDDPAKILSCLDCGAAGVLVPHVATVEKARAIAAAARYRGGRRGYSGSSRAGTYGATPMWTLVDEQDASVCAIAGGAVVSGLAAGAVPAVWAGAAGAAGAGSLALVCGLGTVVGVGSSQFSRYGSDTTTTMARTVRTSSARNQPAEKMLRWAMSSRSSSSRYSSCSGLVAMSPRWIVVCAAEWMLAQSP